MKTFNGYYDMFYSIPVKATTDDIKGILNRKYGLHSTSFENKYIPGIKNVIFNYPATIVFWEDGTKTVVKCQPDDDYSMETGLALCIAKKALGNKGNFNDIFKKWIDYDTRNYYDNLFSIFSNLVGTDSNKEK